ncbi:hypothetical protein KSF73_09140 [Burkholderiaceae bacterium DAT-1]|nr:hypothetical protein [Burkholderiaceae bacterium DAT-1]
MRSTIQFMLILGAVTAVSTAAISASCPDIPADSLKLVKGNPVRAAQRAAKSAHPQLLAISGFAVVTPGVPELAGCPFPKDMVKIIAGTSDSVCGEQGVRFNTQAYQFAEHYNQALLKASPSLKAQLACVKPS